MVKNFWKTSAESATYQNQKWTKEKYLWNLVWKPNDLLAAGKMTPLHLEEIQDLQLKFPLRKKIFVHR